MYNILQLNNKELNELQDIAAEMGIKGSKSLERQDLIYRILDEQAIAGAQKKVASEEAKGDRRQRTRVNKKEVANKVYSADKDKAEKINDTPKIVTTPIAEEKKEEDEEDYDDEEELSEEHYPAKCVGHLDMITFDVSDAAYEKVIDINVAELEPMVVLCGLVQVTEQPLDDTNILISCRLTNLVSSLQFTDYLQILLARKLKP